MLPWNIKLFNHSPARMVVIGRLMHRIASIVCSHLKIQDIYVFTMPKIVAHLYQLTSLMVSLLLLLPWCTAIAGYQLSSNNSNSWQQPTAGYRNQANHSRHKLVNISETTTNRIYVTGFEIAHLPRRITNI